ncbi:hypothetical protein V3C99_009942 [Haemonchus contortus]|nr:Protein LIN-3, isoform c [Haemonchus contortus]
MPSVNDADTPCASTVEDLPGYVRSKEPNSSMICSSSSIRQRRDLLTYLVVIFLIGELVAVEGCLPSWFRKERNESPQALEASNSITIDDPPELLDRTRPPEYDNDKGHRRPSYETNELHESDDESESEELDMIYGTAAPIRMDHRLEEARRRHSKRKCKGWCYRGGNCTVDIDEITYELRSVNCHCPHGYWGNRCELHFVARLFAPVKGNVDVEKSGVSAFAFIILMLIVSIGLIFYTYRKLARRNTAIDSSTLPSLNYHLRRQSVSFQTMPTSVNTSPTNSTASTARSALTHLNCRTPFSPFSKSYSHISGNSCNSVNDLTPSLNMAFERLSMNSVSSKIHSDLPKTDSKKTTCTTANRSTATNSFTSQLSDDSVYHTAVGSFSVEPALVDERNAVQIPLQLATTNETVFVK